jgi:adenine-specific DNA-methyltransferase
MPTLHWVGKDKVVNHHHEVPFRVLNKVSSFRAPEGLPANSTDNRIIHGDNLEALKSLLPEFEGRVKCIYIDPPYNTGNEGWVYNDAVNDPKMKRWLGQVVGKEGEDLSRHDKWLCMMYPRLKLLHRLLAEDGSIWVSIDDNEVHSLRALMDEIFGRNKFIACNVWQKRYSRENREAIGDVHEYLLVYAKNPDRFKQVRNRVPLDEGQAKVYRNPDNPLETDPAKRWRGLPMTAQGFRQNQMYEIVSDSGKRHLPPEGRCWSLIEPEFEKLKAKGRIYWGKDGNGQPSVIRYLSEVEGLVPWTWWPHEEVGHTDESRKEIQSIFGTQTAFDTPKPVRLLERVIHIATQPGDIVLDSFAGSATTGHAVLSLNSKSVAKQRRFILVEIDDYADTVTAERIRRVMTGYGDGAKTVQGLGGGFDYYTVGEPLFQPDDNLNEAVGGEAIRGYVAYSEGIPAADRAAPDNPHSPYLLGLNRETAWIFHYEPDRATSLDMDFLSTLRFGGGTGADKPGTVIIYADRCLLSQDFMRRHGIVFKKIPRDITRF